MQKGLKLMFFMKEKKNGSKGKISIFYENFVKKAVNGSLSQMSQIFLHIFPFQNILHLYLFFRKKHLFWLWPGVPPPESRKYFVKFKRLHGYQFKIRYFYLPNNIPSSLHSELLNSNYCCFCH